MIVMNVVDIFVSSYSLGVSSFDGWMWLERASFILSINREFENESQEIHGETFQKYNN